MEGPTPARLSQRRVETAVDRFGALASLLCAIHCALLPLLFGVLPAIGLAFLAGHTFERVFVSFAILLASISLAHGLRTHGSYLAFLFLVPGILLLVAGLSGASTHGSTAHAVIVSAGGSLIAISHLINQRMHHVHGPSCRH
jgi:hypothetical protein